MGKTPHTPGPWELKIEGSEEDCIVRTVVQSGNGERNLSEVALVTTGSMTDEVEHANAKLISAAPELLDSLKKAWSIIDTEFPNGYSKYSNAYNEAQEAIRKATSPE